jgi:hypothetical protein
MQENNQKTTQLSPVHSAEKWEQAFDALTDHVMILDRSGTIAWANRAIRDQIEPQTGPLVGHHYRTP